MSITTVSRCSGQNLVPDPEPPRCGDHAGRPLRRFLAYSSTVGRSLGGETRCLLCNRAVEVALLNQSDEDDLGCINTWSAMGSVPAGDMTYAPGGIAIEVALGKRS